MMMKERYLQFDVARVFSMIWVVFIWHMSGYMSKEDRTILQFIGAENITNMALGTFMFLSGYFLSKYRFEDICEIKKFYKKRFKRFYMLFALAAFTMWLGGMNPDNQVLLTTLTGLSSFVLPQPKTLWFMSMLMSFYLITPILQSIYNALGVKNVFCKIGGVILLSVMLNIFTKFHEMDTRLLWCFPCYGFGLMIGSTNWIKILSKNIVFGVFAVVLCGGMICYRIDWLHIDVIIGVLSCLSLSYWIAKIPLYRMFMWISYSSMTIYLFHRHIFKLGRVVFPEFPIWFAYFVIMPLTLFVGWSIQKVYDMAIDEVENRKKKKHENFISQ